MSAIDQALPFHTSTSQRDAAEAERVLDRAQRGVVVGGLGVRVVALHAGEAVAAQQAHVVGLAAARAGAEIVGLEAERIREVVEVGGRGVADHVVEAVVLFHDQEDVVEAGSSRGGSAGC
jgi:hypothetical protein